MRILARVIPVLHLVQRFYVGGAERQFIERLRAHPQGFEPVVGCLEISGGNLADFRALGLGDPHHFPLRGSLLSSSAARALAGPQERPLPGALLQTSGHARGAPCSSRTRGCTSRLPCLTG